MHDLKLKLKQLMSEIWIYCESGGFERVRESLPEGNAFLASCLTRPNRGSLWMYRR